MTHWLARVDAAGPARLGALVLELAPPAAAPRLDRDAVKRAQGVLRGLKFSNDELVGAAILVGIFLYARALGTRSLRESVA